MKGHHRTAVSGGSGYVSLSGTLTKEIGWYAFREIDWYTLKEIRWYTLREIRQHAPRPDLPNFFKVNAGLFRGGRPSPTGLEKLAQLGVRTVINLQGGDLDSKMRYIVGKLEQGEFPDAIRKEGEAVKALQMNYLSYPLNSIDPVTPEESLLIAQILKDLQDPLLKPIYIHCEHGKDRTGLLVALERVQAESWEKEAAKTEWFRMGHGRISKLFTRELDHYFDGFSFAAD